MYIHYSVLKEKIVARLIDAGINPSQAEIEAEIMVESDLLVDFGNFPGERGWETKKIQLTQGIELHTEIVNQLETAGISF